MTSWVGVGELLGRPQATAGVGIGVQGLVLLHFTEHRVVYFVCLDTR